MLLKSRSESVELKIMRSLSIQSNLSPKERKYYFKLEKGYQGELMFDLLTEKLQSDMLVINDLCLEMNDTMFQIDTVIIAQDTIYPFEVKNYTGNYFYDSEGFHKISGPDITNPLDQIKRCKLLLRQLLHNLGYKISIEPFVIFINPEFTLYQAPLNQPIIYPTQINGFMKEFDMTPSKLNDRHKKLADRLISLHSNESPYSSRLPTYEYRKLTKGIVHTKCDSFMVSGGEKVVVCEKCGDVEDIESAVLRCVEELKFLFPDLKITTGLVYEWCKVIKSKKMIRRILMNNYKAIGYGRWFYYE
ncbi:NERD domain-containing protein [Bacillus sp. sid0103]|uniref:nuclease-related domain-containing protein n=1 Tax=Bacillus sp. sid0103 TaxID=2856337 RepID=UPI001C490BA7|nr:nuclease-related domain-containing protein [Bacillus sp. sid0103]MBV7505939.1 NERD domain-containing protein [Bacillus sp. sid0103]